MFTKQMVIDLINKNPAFLDGLVTFLNAQVVKENLEEAAKDLQAVYEEYY